MPAALPIISGGLGIYSAIKGAQQQGRARRAQEEQLRQQGVARNMLMGRLGALGQGAVGNPFAGSYGPAAPAPAGGLAARALGAMRTPGITPNDPLGVPGAVPGGNFDPRIPRPIPPPRLY